MGKLKALNLRGNNDKSLKSELLQHNKSKSFKNFCKRHDINFEKIE